MSEQQAPRTRILLHLTHMRRGGGIETSALGWLRNLDRTRFSIGLSIAHPNADLDEVFRPLIPADVSLHILGPEKWLTHFRNLKQAGKLGWLGRVYEELLLPQIRKRVFRRRIERIARDYDVVVDYDMSLARFAGGLSQPVIGISHFSLSARLANNRRKYRSAMRHYRRYTAIAAICDAMREEGRKLFPSLAERFVTIYPGFDLPAIRRRAGIDAESVPASPYIVTVARLEETQKDTTTLIRAYALLAGEGAVSERLLIVGEGRHRSQLEQLAKGLQVQDRVSFLGFKPNPLPYIARASLLVLSSKFEGLPTVLIEALALGQVSVSTDCPTGPREILDDGRAGLLVPVGDASALAEAMRRALRDQPLRQALRQDAAGHAALFGAEAFNRRIAELLQHLHP